MTRSQEYPPSGEWLPHVITTTAAASPLGWIGCPRRLQTRELGGLAAQSQDTATGETTLISHRSQRTGAWWLQVVLLCCVPKPVCAVLRAGNLSPSSG